jgi:catechol 2,3-dioxygenase-like lactoylglutathione lyase family enzyme
MARLRYIAMSVPNPPTAANLYCNAFDMKTVGEIESPLVSGLYLSDGTVSLAPLKYKADEWAGMNKNSKSIHHIGFWVDHVENRSERIKENGGSFFRELPLEKESVYHEMKFRDPNGIIFDISHNGWVGATK